MREENKSDQFCRYASRLMQKQLVGCWNGGVGMEEGGRKGCGGGEGEQSERMREYGKEATQVAKGDKLSLIHI